MKNEFIVAIHAKKKLRLVFFTKEDGRTHIRTCAPIDYGPSSHSHANDTRDRFYFWEYGADSQNRALSLLPTQISEMKMLDQSFDPTEFVTWDVSAYPWHVRRNWG